MTKTKRILIADDDEFLVDALARRCQELDVCVEGAHDGMSALAKIDSLEPDLVILDVNMPSGSGLSVCEMVARDPYLKAIPIIILTGRTDGETIASCNRLDAYYVPKGPEIWVRLELLVLDLLGIERSPATVPQQPQPAETCREDQSHPSPASGNAGLKRQPSPATHGGDRGEDDATASEADRIDDRYFDTILAALGGNKAGRGEHRGDDLPEQAVHRPWVLCVDDDHDFATTLKLRLEHHGVDVLHAYAGMEGYRCAFTHEARAIILDQEMPDGDGEYLLRRLKESPVTEDIPVIVLTGRKDQALARRMYNLGATRFLTKPVDWDDLWEELRPLVHREKEPTSLCQAALD
jgi:DNA-binding response OmpR family regulator